MEFLGVGIRIFFLLTPFFVLSVFVTLTGELTEESRRRIAVRAVLATLIISGVIYFFGETVFRYLGITLDAFRIGAGTILLLTAIELVLGTDRGGSKKVDESEGDIAVVPLAIPYTIGPGTIGALLVMGAGADSARQKLLECLAIALAVLVFGAMLYFSSGVMRVLKRRGLQILSKLTGLVLASLSAQLIFTGIRNILFEGQ